MTRIVIEFDSDWILSHKDDDVLPADFLAGALKDEGLAAASDSFTSCMVDFEGDAEEKQKHILGLLSGRYQGEDVNKVVVVTTITQGNDAKEELAAAEADDGDDEEDDEDGEPGITFEYKEKDISLPDRETVMGQIGALIGADEFKLLAQEICDVAPEIIRSGCYDVFTYQSYLFAINDGFGLSTYLNALSDLVAALSLARPVPHGEGQALPVVRSQTRPKVYEETLPPVKDSMEPFDDVLRIVRNGSRTMINVLCVDISEWMNDTENRYFKEFLRAVEGAMNKFIVVFRIPFVEKDVLEAIRCSLFDLISVRPVTFPPMTKEEIQRYAQDRIASYGFKVKDNAWEYFHLRISEEKSDGKFYGLNTVQKVIRELLYRKHLTNARSKSGDAVIWKKDAKTLVAGGGDELSGTKMLDSLVGSEKIKERIEEIIAQIELALKTKEERPCIHMRFLGNPGTGKTTVARIIGKILKERGVLRVGNFYEYAGRDFCGRYIGETAPKTASICRDAYGSVLFIDEAYSLFRGDRDSRDYGREALDTLIAEMENHRSDFVVIMAGYSDDMETLMEGNLGLKSRMPYAIEFPNFTREQLSEIYLSMLNNKFKYDKSVEHAVRAYFDGIPEEVVSSKEFANARFVRNLFERTWAKAAMRCQLAKEKDVKITKDDFERSTVDKEFAFSEKKKSRLGF